MTNLFRIFWKRAVMHWFVAAGVLIAATVPVRAQSSPSTEESDTKTEIHRLNSELDDTRTQLSQAQAQISQLASELETLRREFNEKTKGLAQTGSSPSSAFPSAADLVRQSQSGSRSSPESISELSDNQKLLAARIEEQHQTKVESESKYRVKLSGLLLMNAFSNRGAFDVADLPERALASADYGSVGASVRQSLIGLQVLGPELAGATTSASISADFFGGFPQQQPYGTTLGVLRLRQASAHLDWIDTSLIIGQESLFFSPLSPTSYATLAEPALSYSANLWTWTPQVVVEHRFHTSKQTYFSLSGGLLAPLADSVASSSSPYGGYVGPGERARRPAYAAQTAFNSKRFGQPLTIGIGGYGSRLQYSYGRRTDSWAVTAFWKMPLLSQLELSGEAYRGRAVGGLGGGIWQSVIYNGPPNTGGITLRPLNAFGGWTQLKFRPHPKWELNSAIGQDNIFSADLEWSPNLVGQYQPPLARNRAAFGNVIYRPKSNLLLSVEYRKVWTYSYNGLGNSSDQVNVGAGVSF